MTSSRTNSLAHRQKSHCEEAAQVHTVQKWITTHTTSSFHSNHRQTEHKEVLLCQEQFSNDETGSMTLELDHFQETLKVQSALGSLMVHRISHITMLITLCCILPQRLSQEIHCWKLHDKSQLR